MRYTLTDVLISGYSVQGPTGGALAPTESVTLNYVKFEMDYGPPGQTTPVRTGWDLARNAKM